MQVAKPPTEHYVNPLNSISIFLAGSIEMGRAEDWQKAAEKYIYIKETKNTVVYNPRRDDWDSSWKEGSPEMIAQIQWELKYLRRSDWIIMYFDPATQSPITLLEFGLYASIRKLIVICPDGFWKKTNIVTTCKFYCTRMCDHITDALKIIYN